jgi:hypothetical protein
MSGCSTREQYLRLVTGGNFGVGAKVAAGSRNPHGLEYRSWHQGQGSLVCFKRHPDGRWGLEPQRWPDGHTDYWRPLGAQDKPSLLRGQDHGTQSRAARPARARRHHPGADERHRRPPALDHPLPQRPLPAACRTGGGAGPRATQPRRARAAAARPGRAAAPRMTRRRRGYGGAERRDGLLVGSRRRPPRQTARSHAVGLERSRRHRLRGRAVRHPAADPGWLRTPAGLRHPLRLRTCVLHLHPHGHAGRLQCNTARTLLLLDHEPLPWARWGEEFTAAMPAEIRQLQERAACTDMLPRREAIRNRVNAILPLYQLSSYRPTPPPRQTATQSTQAAGDDPTDKPEWPRPPNGQPCPDGAGGPPGREHAHEESPPNRPIDDAHDEASPHRIVSLPDVAWISARDGPGHHGTSRTTPPVITPAGTSSRSTQTSGRSPT